LRVFIRADASSRIGTGHLIRCRTLADELRARGAEVRFICRDLPGFAPAILEQEGFEVLTLPAPLADGQGGQNVSAWLGVSQEQDARETADRIGLGRADCLIVDHYALDAVWEHAMRPKAARVAVIDDLADRRHECELLLDQNYGADEAGRYDALVPSGCSCLFGPRYALLRSEYRRFPPRLRRKVERILVSFGGADTGNATGMALEALAAPELSHLHVDAVVGSANPNLAAIRAQADRVGRIRIHGQLPHLAGLMDAADLAIGAGGSTSWERLCVGLPALVVSIADNQVPSSRALAAAGLIEYAGPVESLTALSLRERIIALLGDEQRLSSLSASGPIRVDAFGALRVAELLMPTKSRNLRLVPAQPGDAAIYFGWVNETEVRRQSLNSEPVPWKDHLRWFKARLASSQSRLFVLRTDRDLPVGQIRFDICEDGTARLSYSLDPVARGRGWAAVLVTEGLRKLGALGTFQVHAEVRTSNLASRRVFEKLRFRREGVAEEGVHLYTTSSKDFRTRPQDESIRS
jgi:UDP-2,4-diacetamido-2,4,6-trideoxy-beta-L-altropyranose hydrolase